MQQLAMSDGHDINVYGVRNEDVTLRRTFTGDVGQKRMKWSPNGSFLAVVTIDKYLKVYHAYSDYVFQNKRMNVVSFTWSMDSKTLIVTTSRGVTVFNAHKQFESFKLKIQKRYVNMVLSPDDSLAWARTDNGSVDVLDAITWEPIVSFEGTFSSDAAFRDNLLAVLDSESRLCVLPVGDLSVLVNDLVVQNHRPKFVGRLLWSPDGSMICHSAPEHIRVWSYSSTAPPGLENAIETGNLVYEDSLDALTIEWSGSVLMVVLESSVFCVDPMTARMRVIPFDDVGLSYNTSSLYSPPYASITV
jgi:WD40 repeat protein